MNAHQQELFSVRYATMTRQERLDQLLRIITNANGPLTITQIARLAGLKKSPYVIDLLNRLADDGEITFSDAHLTNGLPVTLIEVA